MGEETVQKWHGRLKTTVNAPIDKAWAISGNFCGLKEWLPTTIKCEKTEGEYQQPGCVRYAAGSSFNGPDGELSWVYEKLLTFDEANHSLSYEMLDNNFGLSGYIGTFKLQALDESVTAVDWSYEVHPVENKTEKEQEQYMTAAFKKALVALEKLVGSQST